MTIVFVYGDPVVNSSILPLCFTAKHRSRTWCDGMWCHCQQYTVIPSIDSWHHDSPEVCHNVLPLMQRLPEASFQLDNARPYSARVSQDCLHIVTTLPWPARSPGLSPIEHIWDNLRW
ncbi:l-Fucosyltransferase [Trichonephila clavipes]|uniref:L-Fucosyltransferase n=1 Tax=Trichonephila clavipes TaxID=2585209 RepID=A0A8X6W464_TRICX|nr:l-Fucosyltransferase [Trichonephila clavipes]